MPRKDINSYTFRQIHFTELTVETASRSLHHSCRSELTRQGILVVGFTDGKMTQVLEGKLSAGDKVIVDQRRGAK